MIVIVIFLINIFDLIQATKLQLNIDPLSIRVDPTLFRLCWDQINSDKMEYLSVIYSPSITLSLPVFNDPHQSSRTFCVERFDTHTYYTVKIPLKWNSKNESFDIIVNFSVKLSPAWDIIRTQIVPSGIHFHLNAIFAGMPLVSPACRILLLFTTSRSKNMIQFEMESHSTNNKFIKLKKGSRYIFYYSCHRFSFVHMSSVISSKNGTTFSEEETLPLRPFIQIPFRKFIVAVWKHPIIVPNSYVILISDSKDKCFRKFRLMRESFIKQNPTPEFQVKSCESELEVDLGYYNGSSNGRINVVLNMGTVARLNSRFKFSIFWKDVNKEIKENFIFFTFLSNENCAHVNPNFVNPNLGNYDDLRNQYSNFNQILMSENHADPITEQRINASGYNDALILPSVSESSPMNIEVVQSETRVNMVKKCNSNSECRRGFFPFFYSLFKISYKEDIITEIIEIPRENVGTVKMSDLELRSNNQTATFRVSWTLVDSIETITPSLYLLEIKSTSPEKCYLACIITCKTCSEDYKKTSLKNNFRNISKRTSKCLQNQTIENNFSAMDEFIFFETLELPNSISLVGSLYAVEFQSIIGPISSKPSIIPNNPKTRQGESNKKILIIFLAAVFFTVLLILFIVLPMGLKKNGRKAKNPIPIIDRVTGNYDDDEDSNAYDKGIYDDDL